MYMDFSKQINKALEKKPKTLDELSFIMGKGRSYVEHEKAILKYFQNNKTMVRPIEIEYYFFGTIFVLLINSFLPNSQFKNIFSLLILLLIPAIWNNRLLPSKYNSSSINIGLIVFELMMIGLVLGVFSLLYSIYIGVFLLVNAILKYIIISKFRKG